MTGRSRFKSTSIQAVYYITAEEECRNHHGDRVPGGGRGCFGLPVGAASHPLLPRLVPVDVAVDEHTAG